MTSVYIMDVNVEVIYRGSVLGVLRVGLHKACYLLSGASDVKYKNIPEHHSQREKNYQSDIVNSSFPVPLTHPLHDFSDTYMYIRQCPMDYYSYIQLNMSRVPLAIEFRVILQVANFFRKKGGRDMLL